MGQRCSSWALRSVNLRSIIEPKKGGQRFSRSAADDDRLLRHELVHVRQWRRLGVGGFLRRYVGAYVRQRLRGYGHWAAYRRIPLEVEAEWRARRMPLDRTTAPL